MSEIFVSYSLYCQIDDASILWEVALSVKKSVSLHLQIRISNEEIWITISDIDNTRTHFSRVAVKITIESCLYFNLLFHPIVIFTLTSCN